MHAVQEFSFILVIESLCKSKQKNRTFELLDVIGVDIVFIQLYRGTLKILRYTPHTTLISIICLFSDYRHWLNKMQLTINGVQMLSTGHATQGLRGIILNRY